MKVLFMGTPEFSVPTLKSLMASGHKVVGVVTQPDRAVKRGRTEPSAVKKVALESGLTVVQPERIRSEVELIKNFGADIAVTAAYGQILTEEIISAFKYGIVNVHASLLPKYRGASPIYSALLNGDKISGVTIMKTERGVDTGDILSAREVDISAFASATEATAALADVGAALLVETLDNYSMITPIKQDESLATRCRMITKSEQFIDFSQPAERVVNQVRALANEPCAKTVIDGEVIKVYSASVARNNFKSGARCGEVLCSVGKLIVACGDGAAELTVIQAPGKRALRAADFLNGKKITVGVVCGQP